MLGSATVSTAQTAVGDMVYAVDRYHVYYKGKVLRDADVRYFRSLGHGYGKDNFHVYFCGEIINNADPSTFAVDTGEGGVQYYAPAQNNFAPTAQNNYQYNGNQNYGNQNYGPNNNQNSGYGSSSSSNANEDNLPGTSLGDGYSKDEYNVYYVGRKIDAMTTSFTVLGGGYAKDSFSVFYEGNKVKKASPNSFKYLGDAIGKDSFNTFVKGKLQSK